MNRVRFFDYLAIGVDFNRVDLKPGVSLLGESTTPGFESALG